MSVCGVWMCLDVKCGCFKTRCVDGCVEDEDSRTEKLGEEENFMLRLGVLNQWVRGLVLLSMQVKL